MQQAVRKVLLKASIAGVGILLLSSSWEPAQAGIAYDLTKLARLCVEVEKLPSEATRDHGLSEGSILNFAYVTLKAKLPRLQIEPRQEPCIAAGDGTLWIIVTLITMERGGIKTGYSANINFWVARPTLWLSGTTGLGIAYVHGMLFTGPMGSAGRSVKEVLDSLLTDLAAEYYKAGNP